MNSTYTKGDVVAITYIKDGNEMEAIGIVLATAKNTITLGRDFRDLLPINTTDISIKEIKTIKKVAPKEICKTDDIDPAP